MYRIFIVEDDEVITAALCAYMACLPPLTRSLF